MEFFQLNWVILLITTLIIVGAWVGQDKKELLSKTIKIEPKKFYLLIAFLGIVVAFVNYIAITVFGSWKALTFASIAAIAIVYGIMWYFKNKKS